MNDAAPSARIHVFGASGSGTTTLGRALAARCRLKHLDADNYLWEPTEPPYQRLRGREERLRLLEADLEAARNEWVLSGSVVGWGDGVASRFTLAVFLTLEHDERVIRLDARARERFGLERLAPGGDMHEGHVAFLRWASAYDTAGVEQRSRVLHEAWIQRLQCPVLRLDSAAPVHELLAAVLIAVAAAGQSETRRSSLPPRWPEPGE